MIKHIVFFKFEEGQDKNLILPGLKSRIDSMKGRIPGLLEIEAGINFSTRDVASDLALVSDFNSVEDLDFYREHPVHQDLINYLKAFRYKVAVVDYEY